MSELFLKTDSDFWDSQTRSLRINGMVTSIRLENCFWAVVERVAQHKEVGVPELISCLYRQSVDAGFATNNFTSFLRCCCIRQLDLQLTDARESLKNLPTLKKAESAPSYSS